QKGLKHRLLGARNRAPGSEPIALADRDLDELIAQQTLTTDTRGASLADEFGGVLANFEPHPNAPALGEAHVLYRTYVDARDPHRAARTKAAHLVEDRRVLDLRGEHRALIPDDEH